MGSNLHRVKVARRAGWLVVAVAAWCGTAEAMPLQELNAHTLGKIAHLSLGDADGEEEGSGSGFVISRDGRVATNYHVVEHATQIVAVFPDKREVKVTGVWSFDKQVDLAILQLASGTYEPLELSPTPAVQGEEIVVIGSPLGLGNAISTGIVSAVREKGIEKTDFRPGEASWSLQITAAAAPGSSGSPILRSDGQVVGVLVGHIGGMEGVHFGITVDKLRRLNAASAKKLLGFPGAPSEASVAQNLLVSAGVFGALGIVWLVVSHLQTRKRKLRH